MQEPNVTLDGSNDPQNLQAGSWIINQIDAHKYVTSRPSDVKNDNVSYLVTHRASEIFVQEIQSQRRLGYGYVPFVGAGFSAPSGAPLVTELEAYLQRCLLLALQDGPNDRWCPRTDQWPPVIDRGGSPEDLQILEKDHWWKKIIKEFAALPFSEERVVQAQGYGSAAEWRTALLFLSRLEHDDNNKLLLGAPLQEVIDSCLRAVLKGKDPSLEHNMLAVLAGALRLDLVLTTNFDDLLERAFAVARNPVEVFEVHLGDTLPALVSSFGSQIVD